MAHKGYKTHELNTGVRPNDDFYPTPPLVTRALIKNITLDDAPIFEPCCGDGAISRELEAVGKNVISRDLYNQGYGNFGFDFLTSPLPLELEGKDFDIITNPPYYLADNFFRRGIELGARRIMFLVRYEYTAGKKRIDIMDTGNIQRVFTLKERVPMFPKKYEGNTKGRSPTNHHAWVIWNRTVSHRPGEFLVRRISIKD